MGVVWLASYPKSGNTWVRALLTAYLRDAAGPLRLDELKGGAARARRLIDERLGLDSSLLSLDELELYLPDFARALHTSAGDEPVIAKIHAANTRTLDGGLVFPPAAGVAICIVRNPLDVAASCAPFFRWTPEQTVEVMADERYVLNRQPGCYGPVVPERLLSWGGHAASWLEEDGPPSLLVRYEDLLADPAAGLRRMLRHMGVDPSPDRVARAVEQAGFERLRQDEQRSGFEEHSKVAATPFFRRGRAGAWRDDLEPRFVERLIRDHAAAMARLGYEALTEEAKACLV